MSIYYTTYSVEQHGKELFLCGCAANVSCVTSKFAAGISDYMCNHHFVDSLATCYRN